MFLKLLGALLLSGPAGAQDEDPPSKPKGGPNVLRFLMMDGSSLLGELGPEELQVITKYGVLTVPVRDILSFTPGLDSKPELSRHLAALIRDLASETVEVREIAAKALDRMGLPLRQELRRFRKDEDPERRARIEKLLTVLQERQEELDFDDPDSLPKAWIHEDVLATDLFAVKGDIKPKTFEITTRYGRMKLKLSDIDTVVRARINQKNVNRSFSVTAEHIAQRSFKNTGIVLGPGDAVTVTAEGAITMSPWGSSKVSTPDGGVTYGWYNQASQIFAGTLVGRVGKSGKIFKLGTRMTFKVKKAGTLRIGIGMNPSYIQNNYPGAYKVRVRVK